jgi:hypothetical protein
MGCAASADKIRLQLRAGDKSLIFRAFAVALQGISIVEVG